MALAAYEEELKRLKERVGGSCGSGGRECEAIVEEGRWRGGGGGNAIDT